MLSRSANNLFWLTRYMERAEYVARLVETAFRLSAMAKSVQAGMNEWHSIIVASGCEEGYYEKYDALAAKSVIDYLMRDRDNPSSILSCFETARHNGRTERTSLSNDIWEVTNQTWHEARQLTETDFTSDRVRSVLDWTKNRSLLFRGAVSSTMLRNEAYWFARLGLFLERADNTARILDVKYHTLLPSPDEVGGGLDYVQWTAILRSVSASRAYHWIYHRELKPWLIAELLILRPEMPRSLMACTNEITHLLDLVSRELGHDGDCTRMAGQLHAKLKYGRIDDFMQHGLHEFLTEFIDDMADLGEEISQQYLS